MGDAKEGKAKRDWASGNGGWKLEHLGRWRSLIDKVFTLGSDHMFA